MPRPKGFANQKRAFTPPHKFFDTHAHKDDLIVLVREGLLTVDYGDRQDVFGPGDMCEVAPGIDHTDKAGPEGASFVLAWRTPR